MEIKGKFKQLHGIVEKTNFRSRKVWITTEDNPQYPQTVEIELHQDKVSLFDDIAEGAEVTASVNLRGREWVGPDGVSKVFNSLVCWKISPSSSPVNNQSNTVAITPEDNQSLPF